MYHEDGKHATTLEPTLKLAHDTRMWKKSLECRQKHNSEFFWGENCPFVSLSTVWLNSTHHRQKYLQVGEGEESYWTIQILLLYCICIVIILQTIQCNGFLQSIHTTLGVIRDTETIRGTWEVCRGYVRAKLCSIRDMRVYRVCHSWEGRDPVINSLPVDLVRGRVSPQVTGNPFRGVRREEPRELYRRHSCPT